MASSTNRYDLTADAVLASLGFPPNIDDANPNKASIEEAIDEFSGRVNSKLEGLGVTPASVTSSDHPNLFFDIRGRLKIRLRAWWHAGNQQDVTLEEEPERDFRIWLLSMKETPSHLVGTVSHNMGIRTQITDPASSDRSTWLTARNGFN